MCDAVNQSITPPGDLNVSDHTMHDSLPAYIISRIHSDIQAKAWSRILVRGSYKRTEAARVSRTEKTNKRFNWQRPTAIQTNESTLELACFPGKDYVLHHSLLVATYLSLTGGNPATVEMQAPDHQACMEIFKGSNLRLMGHIDIVIIGYVEHLAGDSIDWETGTSSSDEMFAWKKFPTPEGRSVAYLGCVVSFWGDIAEQLVHALRSLNLARCVLYVGKTGSLCVSDYPNQVLATGDSSFIDGRLVQWTNAFKDMLHVNGVCNGIHTNVSSPLQESKTWLSEWQSRARWVDCEIGYMARACIERRVQFGYLHIVSDNVAARYPQDLANERQDRVVQARLRLLDQVRRIIKEYVFR